jgi:hypothetical protein
VDTITPPQPNEPIRDPQNFVLVGSAQSRSVVGIPFRLLE